MRMNNDLSRILREWPYTPGEVQARWVQTGPDQRKIQLRLDLGIFEMEEQGRPDGSRPRGDASVLEYYLKHKAPKSGFRLDAEACSELQQEATQYYYRIMAFNALGEHSGMLCDTDHVLDLIDIVSEYAADDETAWQFSQLFPYMRLMNARAYAEMCMACKHYDDAADMVRSALKDLEAFVEENWVKTNEDGSDAAMPIELSMMQDLLRQVEQKRPRTPDEILREEMDQAIRAENYEKAAKLRDQLNALPPSTRKSSGRAPARRREKPAG